MPNKRFRQTRKLVRKVGDAERAPEGGEERPILLEEVRGYPGIPADERPVPLPPLLRYKGYTGSVEYEPGGRAFYGRVQDVVGIISYGSEKLEGLEAEFQLSVDVYLEFCEQDGVGPERPCTGEFHLRVPRGLHLEAAHAARGTQETLNEWITGAMRMRLTAWKQRRAGRRRKPSEQLKPRTAA